ncbi:hypothetical protein TIFTF001_012421 [Ficus carica]|uniref:Uncharacterized protein n=1 Tax=Ficus carica TaxID=3494 RepID=A0AA87ZVX5_FICCA|nr:hypothetical protein TIFTF001_012421 [Ficus carica]
MVTRRSTPVSFKIQSVAASFRSRNGNRSGNLVPTIQISLRSRAATHRSGLHNVRSPKTTSEVREKESGERNSLGASPLDVA